MNISFLYFIRRVQGKIEFQGSPNDLYRSGVDFAAFIDTEAENKDECNEQVVPPAKTPSRNASKVSMRSVSTLSLYSEYDEFGSKSEFDAASIESQQIYESSSKDTVKGSLMKKYFERGAYAAEFLFICCLFILAQIVSSGADYWVSYW